MSWKDSFTAAGSWTDGFGDTAGRSRPHRGTDLARLTLYAWEELTVVNSDLFYESIGYCVWLRAADGTVFGIAHCRKGTRALNGAVLKPGDKIADAATGPTSLNLSNANFPGYEWGGSHFHITMTGGANPFGAEGLMAEEERGDGSDGLTETARGLRSAGPWMDLTWRFLGAGVFWGVAGYLADRWLDTSPWLLLAGSTVGIVVGFVAFWRSFQRMSQKDGKTR